MYVHYFPRDVSSHWPGNTQSRDTDDKNEYVFQVVFQCHTVFCSLFFFFQRSNRISHTRDGTKVLFLFFFFLQLDESLTSRLNVTERSLLEMEGQGRKGGRGIIVRCSSRKEFYLHRRENLLATRLDTGWHPVECLVAGFLRVSELVVRLRKLGAETPLSWDSEADRGRPSDTHHKRFKRNSGKFKSDGKRVSAASEDERHRGRRNRGLRRIEATCGYPLDTGTGPGVAAGDFNSRARRLVVDPILSDTLLY